METRNKDTKVVENTTEEVKNIETVEKENKNKESQNNEVVENTIEEEYVSIRKNVWTDLQDNNYKYKQGDKYPRDGYIPTKERIKELSDYRKNKLGEVLIMKKKNLEEE